jgi:hypothetical protein
MEIYLLMDFNSIIGLIAINNNNEDTYDKPAGNRPPIYACVRASLTYNIDVSIYLMSIVVFVSRPGGSMK